MISTLPAHEAKRSSTRSANLKGLPIPFFVFHMCLTVRPNLVLHITQMRFYVLLKEGTEGTGGTSGHNFSHVEGIGKVSREWT
jgi:hypothetical protein